MKYITFSGVLLVLCITLQAQEGEGYRELENGPGYVGTYHAGAIISLNAITVKNNFAEFSSLLDTFNTDLLGKGYFPFGVEMDMIHKKFIMGLSLGHAYDEEVIGDTMDLEVNLARYGIQLGYMLLNSHRIFVSPEFAINWNRYRLVNSDHKRRIPLEEYKASRDLDIRFNQLTGTIGLKVAYKMYAYNYFDTDFWTVGFYGGYSFAINNSPWLYSRRNRLTTTQHAPLKSMVFGFFVSFQIDPA